MMPLNLCNLGNISLHDCKRNLLGPIDQESSQRMWMEQTSSYFVYRFPSGVIFEGSEFLRFFLVKGFLIENGLIRFCWVEYSKYVKFLGLKLQSRFLLLCSSFVAFKLLQTPFFGSSLLSALFLLVAMIFLVTSLINFTINF